MENRGSTELPPCLIPLVKPWMHPDLIFRFFNGSNGEYFIVQPISPNPFFSKAPDRLDLTLIWFFKPFSMEWGKKFPEFVSRVIADPTLPKDSEKSTSIQGFEVWGNIFSPSVFQESASCWEFAWQGYSIGNAFSFTKMFGESLLQPVAIASFDIQALQRVAQNHPGTQWDRNLQTSEIIALANWKIFKDAKDPISLADQHLERVKEIAERAIADKDWKEAYFNILEGLRLWHESFFWSSRRDLFKLNFEAKIKPLFPKLLPLLKGKSAPTVPTIKETGAK